MYYDCINSGEKLKKNSLLPKAKFFSKRNNKGISDKNHKHVQSLEYI